VATVLILGGGSLVQRLSQDRDSNGGFCAGASTKAAAAPGVRVVEEHPAARSVEVAGVRIVMGPNKSRSFNTSSSITPQPDHRLEYSHRGSFRGVASGPPILYAASQAWLRLWAQSIEGDPCEPGPLRGAIRHSGLALAAHRSPGRPSVATRACDDSGVTQKAQSATGWYPNPKPPRTRRACAQNPGDPRMRCIPIPPCLCTTGIAGSCW
jgi:hypothetical protein